VRNFGGQGVLSNIRMCNYCLSRSKPGHSPTAPPPAARPQPQLQQAATQGNLTTKISSRLSQAMDIASFKRIVSKVEKEADEKADASSNAVPTKNMADGSRSPEGHSQLAKYASEKSTPETGLGGTAGIGDHFERPTQVPVPMFKAIDTMSPGLRTSTAVLDVQYDEEDFAIDEVLADGSLSVDIHGNEAPCAADELERVHVLGDDVGTGGKELAKSVVDCDSVSSKDTHDSCQSSNGNQANYVGTAKNIQDATALPAISVAAGPQAENVGNHSGTLAMPPLLDAVPDVCTQTDETRVEPAGPSPRSVYRERLDTCYRIFLARYVDQLLQGEDLHDKERRLAWVAVIADLALKAAARLKLENLQNLTQMDPRTYVKIKKLQTGDDPTKSTVVKGLVFRKNVAHRRMKSNIEGARLMLIRGALEYQRVENKLASLDTLLDQEREHLRVIVARIVLHKPDLVVVEKTVSSYAKDLLLSHGITAVLNVKLDILEGISRCTGAQIVQSADDLASNAAYMKALNMSHKQSSEVPDGVTLGTCNFSVSTYRVGKTAKTLMSFDQCPQKLGCTILLFGSDYAELCRIKNVMRHALFTAHHMRLERAMLDVEGACVSESQIARLSKDDSLVYSISPFVTLPPSTLSCEQGDARLTTAVGCVEKHQSLLISFCSEGLARDTKACLPELRRINYYSHSDVSIGRFLTAILLEGPLRTRTYRHDNGCVILTVHQLQEELALPDGEDLANGKASIWTWNRNTSPRSNEKGASIRRRRMTSEALSLSFGKFLELSFMGRRLQSCIELDDGPDDEDAPGVNAIDEVPQEKQFMKRDRFFGCGCRVVRLCYKSEQPLGLVTRPKQITWDASLKAAWLESEFAEVEKIACQVFQGIEEALKYVSAQPPSEVKGDNVRIEQLLAEVVSEKEAFLQQIQAIQLDGPQQQKEDSINSHNAELNKLRRLLASKSNAWEHAMSELVCATPVMRGNRWSVFHSPNHSQSGEAAVIGNATDDNGAAVVKAASDTATQDEAQALAVVIEAKLRMESTESEHDGIATSATTEGIGGAGPDSPAPLTESWSQKTSTVSDEVTYLQGSSETAEHVEASPHGDTQPAPTLPHWMTSSGRMRRGFQAQRSSSDISELRGSPRTDMVAGRDSSTDGSHTATDSMQASRGSYDDLHTLALEGGMVGKASSHPVLRSTSTRSERSASTKPRRGTTLLMRLTGMWSSSLVRMGYCFLPTSQEDLVVPIFDMEVSSAVAYALSTTAYADRLVTAKRMLRSSSADDMSSRSDTNTETNPSNPSEDAGWSSAAYIDGHGGNETQMHSMKRSDRGKNNSMDDAESEIHLLSEKGVHVRIQVGAAEEHSPVQGSVVVYYAAQFDAFRKQCCGGDTNYVVSLQRCSKWSPEGGKSRAYFAKTKDDRFIIKQLSRTELDSFLSLAPEYFKYMHGVHRQNARATCLTKILGVYNVTLRKSGKEAVKMDIAVMENLLYGRQVLQVYDLKGSLRSRYVNDKNRKVLWDQNLLETIQSNPILLNSEAKYALENAIVPDTDFLASRGVMDYSMLAAVDKEKGYLVVGIIDFLRQYTWDKMLETYVKSSSIVSGSNSANPTVISPSQYKKRFRKAMASYFVLIPDQWTLSLYEARSAQVTNAELQQHQHQGHQQSRDIGKDD